MDGVATYRRVNTACAGINLASADVDVPTFRKILHCFNSNGALEPVENLVSHLSDADVRPLVDLGNRYIINNRALFYQLERTYYRLGDQKILDNTLLQFGRLLENEEFISSTMALLKEPYGAQRSDLLHFLEHLSTKVTPTNVADVLDVGLTLARSKVVWSLQGHFQGSSQAGRGLRDLTDQIHLFMQEPRDPSYGDIGFRLINELASGNLFSALDEVMGTDGNALRDSVPRLSSVMNFTLADNAQLMDGLTSLFHYLHRPIHCLKGTQTVPDGTMHVVREMMRLRTPDVGSFIKRGNILTLMAMNPFCDFPDQLGTYYPKMFSFADSTAIEPATDLLKAFYRVTATDGAGRTRHPLVELFVDFLANTGNGANGYEDTTGVKLLLPTLAELTERHVWEDALLLTSLPQLEDRKKIQDALAYVLEQIPGTDQTSYSVLMNAIALTKSDSFYNLVYSLRRFVHSDRAFLDPALTALRQAYYTNNVHPFVNLVHDVLRDAPQNGELFSTMFLISERPEFQASVRLISDMSKDGRLKELGGALLTLFHKFAAQGRMEILDGSESVFTYSGRTQHDFSENDLNVFPLGDEWAVSNDSCRQLEPRVSLGDYKDTRFYGQVDHFVSCMKVDQRHDDFGDVISFLRRERTEHQKNFHEFAIDLIRDLDLTREQLSYIGKNFTKSYDDGTFFNSLDSVPLFVNRFVHGVSDAIGVSGQALRPALELFRPLTDLSVRPALRRLELFVGRVLRREDFPQTLKYVDDLVDRKPEPAPAAVPPPYDKQRIRRWIWNKECENLAPHSSQAVIESYKDRRFEQLTDDYNNAITTWDLVDQQPRRSWKFQEFRDFLNGFITKLGDPAQGVRPGATVDALLNLMRYFTLPEGEDKPNEFQHYHRGDLAQWLSDRSDDHRLITYFYPGESKPRVRLVNTMDRLELVLVDADFFAPWPFTGNFPPDFKNNRNFGLFFLGQIAEAWGDEDRAAWPQEIRDKYRDLRPPTLAEAVATIKSTTHTFETLVGFPHLPGCKQVADPADPAAVQFAETHDPYASTGGLPSWFPGFNIPFMRKSLFNIHQTLPVLEENLPVPGYPLGQGGKMANGMRVLRDLFFQLYYSSPEKYRRADFHNIADGERNNLSILMKLVRAGLTRQAVRKLRFMDLKDPSVIAFFDSLIEGATSKEIHQLIDPLIDPRLDRNPAKPQHDLLWSIFRQIFGVIDASEDHDLDESHLKQLAGKSPDEVARIKAEWVKEFGWMKQMGFYTMAVAKPLKILDPFLTTVGPVLRSYGPYLTEHSDKIQSLLSSKDSAYFLRALFEDHDDVGKERFASVLRDLLGDPSRGVDALSLVKSMDEDQSAKNAWDVCYDRLDAVTQLPEYKRLQLADGSRELLDFFEELGADVNGRALANRTRSYLAERLENGDLDQLLLLGSRNPNEFYRVLETSSRYIENGELKDFFSMSRRAISEP